MGNIVNRLVEWQALTERIITNLGNCSYSRTNTKVATGEMSIVNHRGKEGIRSEDSAATPIIARRSTSDPTMVLKMEPVESSPPVGWAGVWECGGEQECGW